MDTSNYESAIRFWVDQVLLLYIVFVTLLTALVLRRESKLGAAIAVNKVAFALVFLGSFLAFWFADFFRSVWWVWFVRGLVSITITGVLWELRRAFGGWGELFDTALRGLGWPGKRDRG